MTTPEVASERHAWPEVLPGGEAVLFTLLDGPLENARIAVLSRRNGEINTLVNGGSNPRYISTGHIVYGVEGSLRAVAFDAERLEVTSAPIPIIDNAITRPSGAANFAVSMNGSLVYVAGDREAFLGKTLVWVDRGGIEEPIAAPPKNYYYPRISPDGSQVAIDVRDSDDDI